MTEMAHDTLQNELPGHLPSLLFFFDVVMIHFALLHTRHPLSGYINVSLFIFDLFSCQELD